MSLTPMAALLRHHTHRLGESAVALVHSGEAVTWAELERRANRRARLLAQCGVQAGDFVTLALANSNLFYEYSFAIWKLGATPNVVSYRLPAAEFRAIVDLVKPSLVIGLDNPLSTGWRFLQGDTPCDDLDPSPVDEVVSTYWKAMTSGGSTGRPKVIVDHNPALWEEGGSLVGQRPGEVVLNPGPLYHNAPFMFSHQALFLGDQVVGMPRFDAEEALRLIEHHRVNWVNFVPTMMKRIWDLPEARTKYDLSSLRMVWHMAAPTPEWLTESWIRWLGADRIFELYGGTEGQGFTMLTGDEWLRKKGSVGRLASSGRIIVVRDDGTECAPGEVGEIYFLSEQGPGSTYHYIGAEPKTMGAGWESLGDLGYLDEDGYLFLSDRRTDLILRGGANVYPAEVEAVLDAHPDVGSSVVIGLPDEDLGQKVHAILRLQEGAAANIEGIHRFITERLAKYKTPQSYEIVSESLRDDAGKVRRSALRDERAAWLLEGVSFRLTP